MISLPNQNAMMQGKTSDDVQQRLESIRLQQRLGESDKVAQEKKLREASQDFEALFLHQLLKQMRATVPKESMLRSQGEEFWQSHFDSEMAERMARQGGIGLGDMIFDQLRQSQVQASRGDETVNTSLSGMTLLPPDAGARLPGFADGPDAAPNAAPDANSDAFSSGRDVSEAPEVPPLFALASTDQPAASARQRTDGLSAHDETPVMAKVRSLARSIEERGGIAPEHPGAMQDVRTASANAPGNAPGNALPVMHWPVDGQVSSGFGWRNDPFTGEKAWHAGIDLAAAEGTPVEAAWDGRVVFVGERGGYGKMVVLEHEQGWRSYYAHNSENSAKVGDLVQAGQTIAAVGSTGRSTGPHLHFEVRQGNVAWNPQQIQDRLLAGMHIGKQASA